MIWRALLLSAALAMSGCASVPTLPQPSMEARFEAHVFVSVDGARLPAEHWAPVDRQPWMIVLALHGINSAATAFGPIGAWLAEQGVATYAYDARGFGRNPDRGQWAGIEVLARDARAALASLRRQHPGVPIAVLGGSLGAAQAVVAFADPAAPQPDRLVLAAPGVMGWAHLPPGYAPALRLGAAVAPWMTVAPSPDMQRNQPTTNSPATLAYVTADPLRIKETRLDVLAGSVDLMQAAHDRLGQITAPVAFLYGGRDFVIDARALAGAVAALPPGAHVALYPDAYHLLLRDLAAPTVYADILAFLRDPRAPLPSSRQPPGVAAAISGSR